MVTALLLKLDLACGHAPAPGYAGVDLHAVALSVERVDLCKFPWPWADGSASELRCVHFIEHVPARDVGWSDSAIGGTDISKVTSERFQRDYLGRDMLCAFFDEAYRVLAPNGKLHVAAPHARSHGAFQDPTHRRYVVEETFFYFDRAWRLANGVDHYTARCDFEVDVKLVAPGNCQAEVRALTARELRQRWNLVDEVHCTLTKRPDVAARAALVITPGSP